MGSSAVALSWKSATDNVAVRGNRIYRNGALIAETDDTKYEDINLAANTRYQFEISAYDAHNNESPKTTAMEQ
jgi:chitinase